MTSSVAPSANEPAAPRVDARTGLPLPDPFPEYIPCPHCGEPEVEAWCYQSRVRCHKCGGWVPHTAEACRGSSPICRPYVEREQRESASGE